MRAPSKRTQSWAVGLGQSGGKPGPFQLEDHENETRTIGVRMKTPKRSERRAAWRRSNADRPTDPATGLRAPRAPWSPSGALSPLQAHLLRTRGHAGHQTTLEVSLGFNRAQRRALHSRKGSRNLLEHGRPTATPLESFRPRCPWNRPAVKMEAFRRLQRRVAEHKARNVWWRRWGRLLRLLLWTLPVVLVRRGARKIRRAR